MTQVERMSEFVEIVGQVKCASCGSTDSLPLEDSGEDQDLVELDIARYMHGKGWRVHEGYPVCPKCLPLFAPSFPANLRNRVNGTGA